MTKLELIEQALEWAYNRGYNQGVDKGHDIANKRAAENAKHQYRLGQIAEAMRAGDTKRVLDLQGGAL